MREKINEQTQEQREKGHGRTEESKRDEVAGGGEGGQGTQRQSLPVL